MPIKVFTFRKLGRCFAYTSDPETATVGKTEAEAIVAVLERDGAIVRRKPVPKVTAETAAVAAEKLEGLTFHQAAQFAHGGRKITRAGREKDWFITYLPSHAPHWARFSPIHAPRALPWPSIHTSKADTDADLRANDWKVLAK